MSESREMYLEMAATIKRRGFGFLLGGIDGPCCFVGAINVPKYFPVGEMIETPALDSIVGGNYTPWRLREDGWTKRDAIAALRIAADLATP